MLIPTQDFRSKDGLYNVIPDQAMLPTPPPSSPVTPASRKRKAYTSDDEEPPSSQSSIFSSSSYRSSPSSRMRGEDLFNARVFQSAETTTTFYKFIATLREKIEHEVKNTSATHKFIKTLRDGGRLMRCYTQNIDGLEAREGLCMELTRGRGNKRRFMKKNYEAPRPTDTQGTDFDAGCEVVQLHGELSNLRCRVCATEQEWTESETEIFLEGAAPRCEKCAEKSDLRQATGKRGLVVGELRPNIVLYGEDHPQNSMLVPLIAFDQSSSPDVLIIMGTSLKVHGLQKVVRDFAKVVHAQKNGRVIFINRTRPSESQWDGVIDDYVAMDCDDWINDLRKRREDLWLRQGELDLKITKPVSQKRKRKSIDETDVQAPRPKKRTMVSVDIPTLKPTQTKNANSTKAKARTTPRKPLTTGWRNQNRSSLGILSPLVQQRPDFSPLAKHFRPLSERDDYIPGSPVSPAYSQITAHTPSPRTARFGSSMHLGTPTPRQNMRAAAASGLRKSRLAAEGIDENGQRTPTTSLKATDQGIDIGASEDVEEGEEIEETDSTPVKKKLSFISGSVDGEIDRPLYPRPTSLLRELFTSAVKSFR